MRKFLGKQWLAALLALAGAFFTAGAIAQPTVGNSCYAASCRGQDAATLGGSCFGHYCGAGYAGNSGGECVGDNCQAGNGNTVGGNCYGNGCKAGSAWNSGGDCYGAGCTPGSGGTVGGRAFPAKNTNCLLGEIYKFPTMRVGGSMTNWNTPVGEACQAVNVGTRWQPKMVEITAVLPPVPAPQPTAVTPLPKNPWDPANLPKCPFSCQAYNPASGSCVGAPMNAC